MASARVEDLRKRLEKEPGSRLFAQLAEELRKEGDLQEAIRVCREGLQRHANYPSARMTLGRALFDSGDLAGARAELEAVLKGAPDNILASRLLGECLEALGDGEGARARYAATLSLSPSEHTTKTRLQALEERLGVAAPVAGPPATAGVARPPAPAVARVPTPAVAPPKPAPPAPVRPHKPASSAAGPARPAPVAPTAPPKAPPVVGAAAAPQVIPAAAKPGVQEGRPAAPASAKPPAAAAAKPPATARPAPAKPPTSPPGRSATAPPSGAASALSVVAAAVAAAKAKIAPRATPAPAVARGAAPPAAGGGSVPMEETVVLDTPATASVSGADATLVMDESEKPVPFSTDDTAFDLEPLTEAGASGRDRDAHETLVMDESERPIPLVSVEEGFELERPYEAPPVRFGDQERTVARAPASEEEEPATIPFADGMAEEEPPATAPFLDEAEVAEDELPATISLREAPPAQAEEVILFDEAEVPASAAEPQPLRPELDDESRTIAIDGRSVEAALLGEPVEAAVTPLEDEPEFVSEDELRDTRTVGMDRGAIQAALHPERTMAVEAEKFESALSAREALLAVAPSAPPIAYDAEVRTIAVGARAIEEALATREPEAAAEGPTEGEPEPAPFETPIHGDIPLREAEPVRSEPVLDEPAGSFADTDEPAGAVAGAVAGAPEAEIASVTLAELYLGQGVREKAVLVLRQVIAREPGNTRAHARLAEIEEAPGADSRAARRQALERTIARLEGMLAAVRRG